jgi:hypothetical protein
VLYCEAGYALGLWVMGFNCNYLYHDELLSVFAVAVNASTRMPCWQTLDTSAQG